MKKVMMQFFVFLTACGLLRGVSWAWWEGAAGDVWKAWQSTSSWSLTGTAPSDIVDKIAKNANENFRIQQNALNTVNATDSSIGQNGNFKITGTLDWLRMNIQPYLQWFVFIAYVIAVFLLILNGFKLVMGSSGMVDGKIETVKENIKNIVIGIVIMTSFVAIISIVNGLLNYFVG